MGQMMIEMIPPCPPVPMVALLPTTWPLQKGAGASRRAPKSEPRVWLQMGLGVDVRLGWAWDILGWGMNSVIFQWLDEFSGVSSALQAGIGFGQREMSIWIWAQEIAIRWALSHRSLDRGTSDSIVPIDTNKMVMTWMWHGVPYLSHVIFGCFSW
jgi:hypothetical protein